MTPQAAPRYTLNKTVSALEIDCCVKISRGARIVSFKDRAIAPVECGPEMFARFVPGPGDFYVLGEDGGEFVKRDAFLRDYAPVAHV